MSDAHAERIDRPGEARVVGIIPARFGSTRFPGKMLHKMAGKPLIQLVWERACRARSLESVIVATDDMRIARAAFNFGAEVAWTKQSHPSGTDRVAEVAARLRGITHVVNIQGDEPDMPPALIDRISRALAAEPARGIVTAARPLGADEDPADPNLVKVVAGRSGQALYFSRAAIPHSRDAGAAPHAQTLIHIGIYGYRIDSLLALVRKRPTPLERSEMLEQLRALEHGVAIHLLRTSHRSSGIDTLRDAQRHEARMTAAQPA